MLYAATGGAATLPAPAPTPAPPVGTASAPPLAPTPSPAPQVQTSPGFSPNYGGLIQSDPGYLAATNASTQANAQGAAARQAALRQLVIRYGGLPAGTTDQYGDIDQATLDAAKANQNSTLAQLGTNYDQSVRQFKQGLAARHMLQSGELGYGQDQLDRGLAQQQYDAGNTFGNSEQGAISSYLQGVAQQRQAVAGAIQGAESNVISQPGNQPVSPTYANYDAGSSATYGFPVYAGADGKLYRQDGSVFDPTAATPPRTPDLTDTGSTTYRTPGLQL